MFAFYISQLIDLHCKLTGLFLCDWYLMDFRFLIKAFPKKFIFYNLVICLICVSQIILTVCSYHVMYLFQRSLLNYVPSAPLCFTCLYALRALAPYAPSYLRTLRAFVPHMSSRLNYATCVPYYSRAFKCDKISY